MIVFIKTEKKRPKRQAKTKEKKQKQRKQLLKIINNKKSLKSHEFLKELSFCCNETNSHLRKLLPQKNEQKLYDAINYAIFSGGKRFRAFLVIQAAKLFEIPIVRALQAASAIEIGHSKNKFSSDLLNNSWE